MRFSSFASAAALVGGPLALLLLASAGDAQTIGPVSKVQTVQRVDVATVRTISPNMARPKGFRAGDLGLALQTITEAQALTPVVAPRPKTIANSCDPAHLKLDWPIQGTAGTTWVTHNYTDQDGAGGKRDFKGAVGDLAITYDGHRGYDICVGTFRDMDRDRVHARAAAPGVVVGVRNDQFDRNTSCTGTWNYVAVKHLNGFVSYYGHLKKGSATVAVGSNVTAGQVLGVIGSSGCSSWAHLHFEVQDCDNKWVDPATVQGMWKTHIPSQEVSGVLDVVLRDGALSQATIIDPAPNVGAIKKGRTLGIGASVAMRGGDELSVLVLRPNLVPSHVTSTVEGRYAQRFPRWSVDVGDTKGTLQWAMWLNDKLVAQGNVTVTD